jgi:hypothetical protein
MKEWQNLANASLRRYSNERDEPWHLEAHAISEAFLADADTTLSEATWRTLLERSAALPGEAGAGSIRRWLFGVGVDLGFTTEKVRLGARVVALSGTLAVVLNECEPSPGRAVGAVGLRQDRLTATGRGWSVVALGGLCDVIQDSIVFAVGRPTDDQLWSLISASSSGTPARLAELFPHLVAQAQQERSTLGSL